MRVFKMTDQWLLKRCPRYRLRRICKAIGIKPYRWQRDFALDRVTCILRAHRHRQTGKTTAVMLRVLMIPGNKKEDWAQAGFALTRDPDYDRERVRWYSSEYRYLRDMCLNAGIPVLRVEVYKMIDTYKTYMGINYY